MAFVFTALLAFLHPRGIPSALQLSSSQGCLVPSRDFLAPISEHCFLSVCLKPQGRKGDRLSCGLSEKAGTRQDLGRQGVSRQAEKRRVEGCCLASLAIDGCLAHTPSPTAGRPQALGTLCEGLGIY